MSSLSIDAQFRYLVQWFNEWSDLQRSDFVPIVAEKLTNAAYVNGIVNSIAQVNTQDKPMSLFQCRVKLFKEWFSQWSPEQKERFVDQISGLDPTFGEKLKEELENCPKTIVENGIDHSED